MAGEVATITSTVDAGMVLSNGNGVTWAYGLRDTHGHLPGAKHRGA